MLAKVKVTKGSIALAYHYDVHWCTLFYVCYNLITCITHARDLSLGNLGVFIVSTNLF